MSEQCKSGAQMYQDFEKIPAVEDNFENGAELNSESVESEHYEAMVFISEAYIALDCA